MHLTHVGELPLPNLPAAARKVHLFPKMGRAMLAIPVLCDHGCQDIFDADGLVMKRKYTGQTVIMGIREKATGLWLVNIADQSNRSNSALAFPTERSPQCCSSKSALMVAEPVTLTAKSAIACETITELIQFLHAALGYPVLDTFRDAIEPGHYSSVPELTVATASKFLDPSAATI